MSQDFLQNNTDLFYKELFKEFNKSKKDLDDLIDILEKWAETQSHFPEKPRTAVLRFVLLYNKFSIEKAKQKLDMYYTIRSLIPEYFRTNPFDMLEEYKVWYLTPLPKLTKNYERIVILKLNPSFDDAKYFNIEKQHCQYVHLMQYLVEQDLAFRFHFIWDPTGYKVAHAVKAHPSDIKKMVVILEQVFSSRLASIQLINFPSYLANFVNSVILPLLNPKLRERVKVHSDTDYIFNLFGKEILPKDLGGEEKSLQDLQNLLIHSYEAYRERFMQLQELTVNELLRPQKLDNDDILGYHGSFRKLDVD